MSYHRENDPIINFILGIVLVVMGVAFFFYPPTPGKALRGRMGGLKAPPVIFTRLFSIGTIGFGVFLIRNCFERNKD